MSKTLDINKLQLFGDKILLKALKVDAVGGLVNPEQYEDKPEWGEIITVGDEVKRYKVGMTIHFGIYSTEKVRNIGNDYYLIREDDIHGYLK